MEVLALARVGDAFGESLELLVERHSAATFFLLLLELFLVSISMAALAVASLVELHLGGLAVKLQILGLALADDDGISEVHVDDNDELLLTGLEEKVLDVRKKNVDFDAAEVNIANTVLMYLDGAADTFGLQGRSKEDIVKPQRATI